MTSAHRRTESSDEPVDEVLKEPSTEKEPGAEPKGGGTDPEPDHEAVGIGVVDSAEVEQ